MNANQKHYYLGYAEAILYMQADRDTKETAERNERPTTKGRLPNTFYEMLDDKWIDHKFSVDDFRAVIRELDEDGGTVRIKFEERDGDTYYELAHTEGYRGVPADMEDCWA